MEPLTDRFGRTITKEGNTYSTEGISVNAVDDYQALNTFNAMAPEDWEEPVEEENI